MARMNFSRDHQIAGDRGADYLQTKAQGSSENPDETEGNGGSLRYSANITGESA